MNPNPSSPDSPRHDEVSERNDAVLKKLRSYRWKGRVLTAIALTVGLLSIVVGVALNLANSRVIFPNIESMLKDSPAANPWNGWRERTNSLAQTNTNAVAINMNDGRTVSSSDPEWRHAVVTLLLAKAMALTSLSITLLGVGILLTLLLVIFNRHVTLRQINVSLAQISHQIKELQSGGGAGPAQ